MKNNPESGINESQSSTIPSVDNTIHHSMKGYDIDGVLTTGIVPEPGSVVIYGRTFDEYDDFAKKAAQLCPVYIRGVGKPGDRRHAGRFKAAMIKQLGVTEFYEDDDLQIQYIKETNPEVIIHKI